MDLLGALLSFVYVFAVLGIAQLLLGRGAITAAVTRKIVHIGVSHYWLIAMAMIDAWWFAAIPPAAFIAINTASYFARLFPAMEHEERRKNLGTIYFPVVLLIAVLLTWAGPIPIWMGGAGILVLGWGDGLAALVGENTSGRKFKIVGNTKSILGTLTMFVASTTVIATFLFAFGAYSGVLAIVGVSVLVGALATIAELFTPFGLDNLTVPLVVMFALYLL